MLDIAVIIPELMKYGGAERVVLECVARWQLKHRITLYSTRFNRQMLAEHQVEDHVSLADAVTGLRR